MEYLSDVYQKSEKYRNAVSQLPEGWETLVTLNYMILQYGVREWQQDRMEDIIQEMKKRKVTVKNLRSQTNVVGKGSMKKDELLNLRAKEELRENFKDDSYPFGEEIAFFLEENKDTLQRVIRSIRPGSHGLLRYKDIEDIDSLRFYLSGIDYNVIDGVEYVYSVASYDRGVSEETTEFVLTNDGTYVQQITSIPDPDGWGEINPFRMLESPKGTTIHEPNFVKVIPGYVPEANLNEVRVVPNPYIVNSEYNETEYKKKIRFTRLPNKCTISIYTVSGEKVRVLEHDSMVDGNAWWDLRSYNNQVIAPGLYIYVVETPSGDKKVDKFAVVR